jgi:hypothetical protein
MNLATVEKIAKAVLYEGYMLYPYRPSSVKNQQRWNFGVLCPQSYSEAQNGSEAWAMQTECLVEGAPHTAIEVRVRFLQLVARTVGERAGLTSPSAELPLSEDDFRTVQTLTVNGRVYRPWQEAVEREVCIPQCNLQSLTNAPAIESFIFYEEKELEPLRDSTAVIVGILARERRALNGEVEVSAASQSDGIFRLTVRIRNIASFEATANTSREEALPSAFVSTHTILGVQNGTFTSLLAPPEEMAALAANCKNIGTWPVLVGEEGNRDTLLSSPIILYDYPQIAPESAGDLFDGTEIDEILSLRIMTLTDEEKREMSQSDERARQMLERTETMPVEHLMKLHGVLRGLRPLDEEAP